MPTETAARAAMPDAGPTWQTRLAALERRSARLAPRGAQLDRASERLAWARLIVFAGGAAIGFVGFLLGRAPVVWSGFLLMIVVFGALVRLHRRVDAAAARLQAWLAIRGAHVARLRLDWAALAAPATGPRRAAHPFEGDLDLVGERSLHQLLDTAVSVEGSARLRDHLTAEVPDPARIAARQAVVRELVPRQQWRDRLALRARVALGGEARWEAAGFVRWLAKAAATDGRRKWVVILGALGLVDILLAGARLLGAWGGAGALLRVTFPVYVLLYLVASRGMGNPFAEALDLERLLRRLTAIFSYLERDAYHGAPHLRALCAPFLDRDHRPSAYVGRASRLLALAGLRSNGLLWLVLNALGPWDLFLAHRLDRCRAALADDAPRWLDVWFELEALAALANLGWLHPACSFPTIVAAGDEGAPVFDARDLGHPLLPAASSVRNDFRFTQLGEVALVTGSNMSGKSTFLKAVGVNLALAFAGGPVDAGRMATRAFRPFTCIRVTDSVTDGISYFYAEVKRLKALLTALEAEHPLPLFFLIDEIFRGTNNRERLIGSRAFIRALAAGRGVGLIATHDLELVALADEIASVANHHFRDEVTDGRMSFDYRLHPGPCPTTNALRIMRLEGLPE